MRRSAAVVALALSAVLIGATGAPAAAPGKTHRLPKDVCALLTDAQVSAVVPSAVAKQEPGTATQASCFWQAGGASLAVGITKVTTSARQAKAELKSAAKKVGAKPAKGVGDFAYQSSPSPPFSHVGMLVGNLVLSIDFAPGHPVTAAEKAKVLSIAKTLAKHV